MHNNTKNPDTTCACGKVITEVCYGQVCRVERARLGIRHYLDRLNPDHRNWLLRKLIAYYWG